MTNSRRPDRSGLRRLPRPVSEPPFDDEVADSPRPAPSAVPVNQGSLALAFVLPSGVPAVPEPSSQLRLVESQHSRQADSDGRSGEVADLVARRPTRSADLPEPGAWAGRLAQAILETLNGQRPLQQLLRWTDETVYETIAHRLAARSRHRGSTARPRIRSLRFSQPRDPVVEVSVVVQRGPRCRAMALRLEGLDGRWLCTALEII